MFFFMSKNSPMSTSTPAKRQSLSVWHPILGSALGTLRQLAGATESEFLQIGEQMQGIYLRSAEISKQANHLVDIASGERMHSLIARLNQMIGDIEAYLSSARSRSSESSETLNGVQDLLGQVAKPLAGFQQMNMTLHMLGVSIKIESARLGASGKEFVNLALDVEKLSRQVEEKSEAILDQRQDLLSMIIENMLSLGTTGSLHEVEVTKTLGNTMTGLQELEAANDRFTQLGGRVAAISTEITANIGEVVTSLQFHDINRQQVEHVIEALEQLTESFAGVEKKHHDEASLRALIVEVGNVCELQEAQLHFASLELYSAVSSIIENLRQVGGKQAALGQETLTATGVLDASDTSFVDDISRGMASVTAVLTSCVSTDHEMSATMKRVAATVGEITAFVQDIDDIGFQIVLLALNAQAKAAHAGELGAGLGVLAEAIRQLSDEAVQRTNAVSVTLTEIHSATERLSVGSSEDEAKLCAKLLAMEEEFTEVLKMLAEMNAELLAILSQVQGMVHGLSEEVTRITTQIDVHERIKTMADEVLGMLHTIVSQARELVPASTEFKKNLRLMEEKYTMESERRIHEAIAMKHGVQLERAESAQVAEGASSSDSEFGDNVDLF